MPDPTSRDRIDAAGVAATVVCCLLWGGNAVAVKYAVPPQTVCRDAQGNMTVNNTEASSIPTRE